MDGDPNIVEQTWHSTTMPGRAGLGNTPNRRQEASRASHLSTSPANLRQVLRDRQHARSLNSCAPCRERKVRCGREHPCSTCVKRGHPDLCVYPHKTPHRDEPQSHHAASPARFDGVTAEGPNPFEACQPASGTPRAPHPTIRSPASARLLEGSSLLALAREDSPRSQLGEEGLRDALESGVMPLLGMGDARKENERPGNSPSDEAYASLPSDMEMLTLFTVYKARVHSFQPIVDDMVQVESSLCALIDQRTENSSSRLAQSPEEITTSRRFLCLLYAILATGAHFSDLPVGSRTELCRQYVQSTFRMLRLCNGLVTPFKEALQGLLILGNVLQNNGNPHAAWILGGSTLRMAIHLGVHVRDDTTRHAAMQINRETARRLRLALIWQDALLSLAFNRSPASSEMDHESDLPPLSPSESQSPSNLGYGEAMNWLCHLALRNWQPASTISRHWSMDAFTRLFNEIDRLDRSLASHLQTRQCCTSIQAIQEHYSFELHRNFLISVFCRPVLSTRIIHDLDNFQTSQVIERLQGALKCSVRAFTRLRSITNHATRSWAFVHNGLTSALLLAFMKTTRNEVESKQIQDELIRSLTTGHDTDLQSEDNVIGQLSHAHRQSLKALQSLRKFTDDESARTTQAERAGDENAERISIAPSLPLHTEDALSSVNIPELFDFDEIFNSFDMNAAFPMDSFDYSFYTSPQQTWNP